MLIGVVAGILTEGSARAFRLWIYRKPVFPIVNILLVFGLLMGAVAGVVPAVGWGAAFLIGFGVGLVYEIANLAVLDWWYFPGERLAFVRGHAAIVGTISLLWGAVPVMIATVHAAFPGK